MSDHYSATAIWGEGAHSTIKIHDRAMGQVGITKSRFINKLYQYPGYGCSRSVGIDQSRPGRPVAQVVEPDEDGERRHPQLPGTLGERAEEQVLDAGPVDDDADGGEADGGEADGAHDGGQRDQRVDDEVGAELARRDRLGGRALWRL